jgi:hypothetical protein
MFAELHGNLLHLVLGSELTPGTDYRFSSARYSTIAHTKWIRSSFTCWIRVQIPVSVGVAMYEAVGLVQGEEGDIIKEE